MLKNGGEKISLRDTRVARNVTSPFLNPSFAISNIATASRRILRLPANRISHPILGAVDRKRPGSPGAKKGGNSSLGERNFRISVAGTELSHRRESSFPSRSSVSLATPLINSRTGGGRKGFPYLRQRFLARTITYGFPSRYVRRFSLLVRACFFFFILLFRQLADVHVSILRARARSSPIYTTRSLSPRNDQTFRFLEHRAFSHLSHKRYFFINIKRKTTRLYISS